MFKRHFSIFIFSLFIIAQNASAQDSFNEWRPSRGFIQYIIQNQQIDSLIEKTNSKHDAIEECFNLSYQDKEIVTASIQSTHDALHGMVTSTTIELISHWFSSHAGKHLLLEQQKLVDSKIDVESISKEQKKLNLQLQQVFNLPVELAQIIRTPYMEDTRSIMRLAQANRQFMIRNPDCYDAYSKALSASGISDAKNYD